MQVFEVLMACVLCGAGVGEVSPEKKLSEVLAAARWSIGPEVSWVHYEEPDLMEEAIQQALHIFQDRSNWKNLMANGMKADFSWDRSAERYIALFRSVVENVSFHQ